MSHLSESLKRGQCNHRKPCPLDQQFEAKNWSGRVSKD